MIEEKKTIQKSVRMKQSIYDFIEQFQGNGFNEKLENMTLYFLTTKDNMDQQIKERGKILKELNEEIEIKKRSAMEIEDCFRELNRIYWIIQKYGK